MPREISRQDAKTQRLRDLEIVDDSMNAIFKDSFTKIDQEP
jgi:hypothetical protein